MGENIYKWYDHEGINLQNIQMAHSAQYKKELIYMYVCVYIYMYIYIYMCVCVYIYIYIYIWAHAAQYKKIQPNQKI